MSNYFTPPTRTVYRIMEGVLKFGVYTPDLVWKKNGQWFTSPAPTGDTLIGADAVINCPQIVSAQWASELQAAGIGTVTTV